MIDEQSSASGHDYASDRSAIVAGSYVDKKGGCLSMEFIYTCKNIVDFESYMYYT